MRVLSPVTGVAMPMKSVPDPVFAQEIVGPGGAVMAAAGHSDAVSPVDGVIATLHPHAFVVTSASGVAVLVHLGIDTVKLEGEGFSTHVSKGDTVAAGQPVIAWNPGAVREAGHPPVCPVVALEADPSVIDRVAKPGEIKAGELLFDWTV